MAVAALSLALVAVTACGGGGGKSDDDAIRDVIGKELDAIHHEDWGDLFDLQSPSRREACDREAWKSALAALYGDAYEDTSKVGYDVSEVVVEGDRATVTLTESYDGEDVGTDDFEYRKIDGRWHSAETGCPGGSAKKGGDAAGSGAVSGDVQDKIATVIEAMERIMDDDDADLDEALAMKSTVASIIQALGPGSYQADMLDSAWRTFVRHAEGDDASDRTLAISVDPTGVVRQLEAAAGVLKRQASDKTRTANASATPAVNRTATAAAATARTTATTRATTPTARAATPTAGRPDGPYGSQGSATVTFNGQTSQFTGGRCTLEEGGTRMRLALMNGTDKFSLIVNAPALSTLQQAVEAGKPLGIVLDFSVGSVHWIATTGTRTVIELATDLGSGTYTGTFFNTGGGGEHPGTGSFTC